MKRTVLTAALATGLVTTFAVASFAPSSQVDETELERQLDQIALMLGFTPVDPDELERRVEEIGGLEFRSKVPIDFMSREELAKYIRELFDEEYPEAYAEREERALRAFGFLDEQQDLRTIRERVLNENVAGFYDERPGAKKLFAISSGRTLSFMNQLILSHELRHALQDQYVIIRDKLAVESDFDDRRLAALCLLEGDATLLMERYLTSGASQERPEMANLFEALSSGLSGPEVAAMFAGPALQSAPPVVQEQLVAPYGQGRNLAVAIHEKGGFDLLNASLERPPRSMEQVLHPEKYLDGSDEPVTVRLPEIGDREIDFEGRLGELLIRALLRHGASSDDAVTAAEGWGGDHYAVVANEDADYDLLWKSVWDTREDAREFEAALVSRMNTRFGASGYEIETSGREVVFARRGVR